VRKLNRKDVVMKSVLAVALNPAVDFSGEADAVQHTRKVRTGNDRFDPGGGGVNVARVITMFGGDAEALLLAGGEMGALLERLLKERSVRYRSLPVAGQTRVSFTVRDRMTGREYRFVPKGPSVRRDEIQSFFDMAASRKVDYLVASGSLPEGCPPDIYAHMADLAAARGTRFVLDSSGEGLRTTLERSRVFLVKPSVGELEQFAGRKLGEDDVHRVARDLVADGAAELVAVTMGAGGALLASADGVLRLPAIHVSQQSAVGAGDSFLGGMVWALSEGRSVVDAFRFGIAAGAAAVMTPGTELCRRKDTMALFEGMHGAAA
jgi:6-phosphofructokinase 2